MRQVFLIKSFVEIFVLKFEEKQVWPAVTEFRLLREPWFEIVRSHVQMVAKKRLGQSWPSNYNYSLLLNQISRRILFSFLTTVSTFQNQYLSTTTKTWKTLQDQILNCRQLLSRTLAVTHFCLHLFKMLSVNHLRYPYGKQKVCIAWKYVAWKYVVCSFEFGLFFRIQIITCPILAKINSIFDCFFWKVKSCIALSR